MLSDMDLLVCLEYDLNLCFHLDYLESNLKLMTMLNIHLGYLFFLKKNKVLLDFIRKINLLNYQLNFYT
jgi:hypothetical protein